MIDTADDGSRSFRDFELAGWEQVPSHYDDAFADLTSQAAEPLLDAAGVAAGTQLLDVATGPGYVAALAAGRGAHVIGIDFSSTMVELARRLHPGVEFRVGDAESLALAADAFDAVVMNFGLLHLGHPERAIAEAHRVLRSGGRFAFTVWAPPSEAVGFGIVLGAIEAHGRMEGAIPAGPPFFHYSDPAVSTQALLDAGFTEPVVGRVQQEWRLPSPDALLQRMITGTVRTAGLLRAQSPGDLAAIRGAIVDGAARYATGEGIIMPMPAVLVSGRKG